MDLLEKYWEMIIGFITLVVILSRMRVDIDVLKDKMKTVFQMLNRRRDE